MLTLPLVLVALPVLQADERPFDAPLVLLDEDVAPFRRMIDPDGDPFPDAVGAWANSNNSQFRVDVYQNDGTGGYDVVWSDPSVVPGSPSAGHSPELKIEVADLDGDGDDDFCVIQGNQVWDFTVGGGTVTPTKLNTSLAGVFGFGLRDLDGDGAADHVMSHIFDLTIEYADGTSVTVLHQLYDFPLTLDETAEAAIRFLDGDGDGDLDILLAGNPRYQWLWLDGAGKPVAGSPRIELGFEASKTDVGDVDGDGDLDAMIGNAGANGLLLNDGAGVFASGSAQLPGLDEPTRALALGDLDGDGDADAFVGNDEENRLYLNDGGGVFANAPGQLSAEKAHTDAVALGDLDGDGDLDALVGNSHGDRNRLYTNLSRQLAWRGLPRVGKPLAMDLHGPPASPWSLALSLGNASTPLPPFGTLQLDLASLLVVASGSLGGGGSDSASFAVPPGPGLVGTTVYWQALIGAPALLSNLDVTTFTGF